MNLDLSITSLELFFAKLVKFFLIALEYTIFIDIVDIFLSSVDTDL
jgi:hypothetical protein